jgi:uncharacterized protein YdeI (BOF family)
MKRVVVSLLAALACGSALAADKDTRAGSCDDAKKQVEYFCRENPNDTMVSIGTACTNAKNNQKAACEGVSEADKKYEFEDKNKK